MPKKEAAESTNNNTANGDALTASVVSSNPERQRSSSGDQLGGSGGKDRAEDGEDCQDGDLSDADADEDESDLDMAWKMLDIARAITDKHSIDTMEKVDILCTIAEISLEREDIESSLSDYKTTLSILERLVEPDSRHIAELHFRVCICLETGCQPKEAIPYLLVVLISRYPTFIDALRNLDDCLTMVHLFAVLPASDRENLDVKRVHNCRRFQESPCFGIFLLSVGWCLGKEKVHLLRRMMRVLHIISLISQVRVICIC